MDQAIAALLELVNETLASAIVIIAASILLYNLSRNLNDRVARTSAIVLGCMTVVYIGDVFISLGPGAGTYSAILRLQWIGIAFMPVAMLHLSDALLATTGLPSRGRRRRIIRALYIVSAGFLLSAAFSNWLIAPTEVFPAYFSGNDFVSLQAGPLFPLYVAYFLIVTGVAFINVGRAKQRCLTRGTRRRMGYLQFALLTPAIGIFPFSILLGAGQEYTLAGLLMVNLANIVVILMLIFLAYPLSFFGSRVPDRMVKSELLRFFLRGPATGLIALVVILYTAPATRILGIPGQDFMPFAVVAVVLLWQWFVALALPYLEKWLVFSGEDRERLDKLQYLSERLLTRSDLLQLLEATLAATCDYLRVNTAFVVSFNGAGTNGSEPELVAAIGPARPATSLLISEEASLRSLLDSGSDQTPPQVWQGFWILPLFKTRAAASPNQLIGFMGIQARSAVIDLTDDELEMLESFAHRAAQTLDDLALQAEIIAALEGLLPQINITPANRDRLEYRQPRVPVAETTIGDPEQFKEQVRAALRHYWGGPGLTNSRLLELNIVRQALAENDNNPTRALRSVLLRVIEAQRPEGERKLLSPEWTIYNILEMRYLKGAKVKEVVSRLAMSEPDLYRKQRIAIDAVAETLIELEQASLSQDRRAAPIEDPAQLPSQP